MADPLTRDQFADVVADVLIQVSAPDGELFIDRQRFALVIKDPQGRPTQEIYLGNYFDEYCVADPTGQEAIIARAATIIANIPSPRESSDSGDFRSRLLLQVKDRWSVEKMNLSLAAGRLGAPEATANIFLPFSAITEHFAFLVVEDLPEQMAYITTQQLESWGMTFKEAFDLAAANLFKRKDYEFQLYGDEQGNTLFAKSAWNDNYDAARAIFGEDLSQLPVSGDPLVFLLNQNELVVTGSDSENGLINALVMMLQAQEDPRALPPFVMRLNAQGYTFFDVPSSSALWAPVHEVQMNYMAYLYAAQRESLEGQFKQLIGECNLGVYELLAPSPSGIHTICRIDERRLPMLLPCAESFVLSKGNDVITARWEIFLKVMAEQMGDTDYYPALMLLKAFPTDEQLRLLQQG